MGIAPTRACSEDEALSALVLAGYWAAAITVRMCKVAGGLDTAWVMRCMACSWGLRAGVGQAHFGCRCPCAICSLIDLLTCKRCVLCHGSLLGKRHSWDRFCPKILQLLSAPTETAGAWYHSAQRYFGYKCVHLALIPVQVPSNPPECFRGSASFQKKPA